MESNAKQIKKRYKTLLDDGNPHTRKELFDYAQKESEEIYTEGRLAGALKTFVDTNPDYVVISRGVYQKEGELAVLVENTKKHTGGVEHRTQIIEAYGILLKEVLKDFEQNRVNPMELLKLSDADMEKLKEIQKCMNVMKETLKKIEN